MPLALLRRWMEGASKRSAPAALLLHPQEEAIHMLQAYLEALGWEVVSCRTLAEAFRHLRGHRRFRLWVTATAVEGQSTFRLLRELRESDRAMHHVAAVFVGEGKVLPAEAEQIRTTFTRAVLIGRPYDRRTIQAAIREAVGTSESGRRSAAAAGRG